MSGKTKRPDFSRVHLFDGEHGEMGDIIRETITRTYFGTLNNRYNVNKYKPGTPELPEQVAFDNSYLELEECPEYPEEIRLHFRITHLDTVTGELYQYGTNVYFYKGLKGDLLLKEMFDERGTDIREWWDKEQRRIVYIPDFVRSLYLIKFGTTD